MLKKTNLFSLLLCSIVILLNFNSSVAQINVAVPQDALLNPQMPMQSEYNANIASADANLLTRIRENIRSVVQRLRFGSRVTFSPEHLDTPPQLGDSEIMHYTMSNARPTPFKRLSQRVRNRFGMPTKSANIATKSTTSPPPPELQFYGALSQKYHMLGKPVIILGVLEDPLKEANLSAPSIEVNKTSS